MGNSETEAESPRSSLAWPGARNTKGVADSEYHKAISVLRHCCHPAGLKASGRRYGHRQVWARDSMIALLGACLLDDEEIGCALHASIATLKAHQTAAGCIPNNVDAESGRANFRAYADGGLWFVIGSCLLEPDYETVRRTLHWYECQDVDQSGLVNIQESSDWQDLFCTRGKGLYVNCLYSLALRKAAEVAARRRDQAQSRAYEQRANLVRERINELFWYEGDGEMLRHVAHSFSTASGNEYDSLGRKRWIPRKRILVDERYYLPYLSFRQAGEWFDVFGNLMAILTGVSGDRRTRLILDLIERHDLAAHPATAIYPPIQPGDQDWRAYYGSLNQPHRYHNGGVWPFIGGFYVAALVKVGELAKARNALERLAELNRRGEFNEWHHGETGEPMGVAEQAWSAGMYLYAYECVKRGEVLFL